MAVGDAPKMSLSVWKVPAKPAMAAWRRARAAAGVAEVIVVPEPTLRIVLVGLFMLLLSTGLPWRLKLMARALASLGASAIDAATAAAVKGTSLVVFIRDSVATNAKDPSKLSRNFGGWPNEGEAWAETV